MRVVCYALDWVDDGLVISAEYRIEYIYCIISWPVSPIHCQHWPRYFKLNSIRNIQLVVLNVNPAIFASLHLPPYEHACFEIKYLRRTLENILSWPLPCFIWTPGVRSFSGDGADRGGGRRWDKQCYFCGPELSLSQDQGCHSVS